MDELEIANLLYRCAEHIDNGDLASAAALFSRARVKPYPDSEALNHEELLDLWQSEIAIHPDGTPKTRHLISNPIITIDRKNGKASCRSYFTVLQARGVLPLQISMSGQYHDEFVFADNCWQFSFRECAELNTGQDTAHGSQLSDEPAGPEQANTSTRNTASVTKTKILAAAQQVFSTVGYSEAGIRKIAELVGVSPTILFRHFGTKARLFEEAFVAAMGEPAPPANKARFGQHLAAMLADPTQINSPHAMSVLAYGNEEAREIAVRVLQEYAFVPMTDWLGPPNAESRAQEIMALCAGFALYNSKLKMTPSKGADPHMVEWFSRNIQAIVDEC